MIAHNGEINTVKGNFNWLRARERAVETAVLGDDVKKLLPIIYEGQSDTACLDNMLELLVMSGYSLAQAVMLTIPEAWEQAKGQMDPAQRAFYEYYAAMLDLGTVRRLSDLPTVCASVPYSTETVFVRAAIF